MRIGLCTTTIHVPHALKLMRKCSADVKFFIALDKKNAEATETFCAQEVSNSYTCFRGIENDLSGWKCSEAIGWNTLARRNIAFLEALKWGADVIYS